MQTSLICFSDVIVVGEMVIFNNQRMLHGRTGFEIDGKTTTGRQLETCYFDWDSLYGAMRPVKRRLHTEPRDLSKED